MAKARANERLKAATDAVDFPRPDSLFPIQELSPDVWQVVVTGTIDPRQHVPEWYHLIGCLSDEELVLAKKSAVIVSIPPQMVPMQANTCQFDAGPFEIIAVQDKWTIQTVTENNRSRMLDIASV